ncbi:MAG TPA: hypothetical protein VHP33_01680 [Polyangiaceae bacterium]|nr:hypothetical protein [Polyangiaceae bacterium]
MGKLHVALPWVCCALIGCTDAASSTAKGTDGGSDIWAGRDQKLEAARKRRRLQRQIARCSTADPNAAVA